MLQLMHRYPTGSVVQRRNGYIFVKTEEGFVSEHRLVAVLRLENRELMPGEKVYHKDGNRENNQPENLVVIRFSQTKYRFLPRSRVLYMPKGKDVSVQQALEARIG